MIKTSLTGQVKYKDYIIIIIIIICYIYIALFWVLKALYIEGGNLFNHHQCAASTWMMRRQPYWARTPTTHQLIGGEETEWWSQSEDGVIRRPWWSEANGEIWNLWFLMTTESQDLGLTSCPKDDAFYSIVSPSLHWGVKTHTDHRVSTPCWPH